jgi:uncharacterized protein (DUF305 family)
MSLSNVVTRSIVLLVAATLFVGFALWSGLPELGGRAAGHERDATAAAAASGAGHPQHAAVASEADFVAGMIPHHQEAVDSARAVLAVAERPEVRALAEDVVRVQAEEIAQLEAWLAAWWPEQPAHDSYVPMMRPLEGLDAERAEVAFVEDMIAHHEMAIAMAEAYLALDAPRRPEVEALAHDVIRTQGDEIQRMHDWLEAWGVEGHESERHGGH